MGAHDAKVVPLRGQRPTEDEQIDAFFGRWQTTGQPDDLAEWAGRVIVRADRALSEGRADDVLADCERLFDFARLIEIPDAFWLAARAYLELGEPENALDAIDEGLAHLPDDAPLHVAHAEILLSLSRVEAARRACDRALHFDSDHADAFYVRSRCRAFEGKLTQRELDLSRAIRRDPRPLWLAERAASRAGEKRNAERAFRDIERAFAEAPHLREVREARVCVYEAFGRDREVVDDAVALALELPNDHHSHEHAAAMLARLGRFSEARELMHRHVRENDSAPEACRAFARFLRDQGEAPAAIAVLERGLAVVPRHRELLLDRAMLLARLGGPYDAAARKAFEEAVRAHPNEPRMRFERGIFHHHRRRYGLAGRDFERAVHLDPENERAWWFLARNAQERGDFPLAIRAFSEAAELSDDAAFQMIADRGHARLAAYRVERRRQWLRQALFDFEFVIRHARDAVPSAYCGRAYVREELDGDWEESFADLSIACAADPSDPTPRFQRALLAEKYERGVCMMRDLRYAARRGHSGALDKLRALGRPYVPHAKSK